jgi:hypothetical protein
MDARDSAETNRRGGFDFAARRTRRAYGDRHASFVAVLAGVCTADAKIPPWTPSGSPSRSLGGRAARLCPLE